MLLHKESAERLWKIAEDAGLRLDRFWLDSERDAWHWVQERCVAGEAVAGGSGIDGWVVWLGHGGMGYSVRGIAPVDERVKAPVGGLHKKAGSDETRENWLGWWLGFESAKKASADLPAFKVGDRVIGLAGKRGAAMLAKVAQVAPDGGIASVAIDKSGTSVDAGGMHKWLPVYENRWGGFDALWERGRTSADGYLQLRTSLHNAQRTIDKRLMADSDDGDTAPRSSSGLYLPIDMTPEERLAASQEAARQAVKRAAKK